MVVWGGSGCSLTHEQNPSDESIRKASINHACLPSAVQFSNQKLQILCKVQSTSDTKLWTKWKWQWRKCQKRCEVKKSETNNDNRGACIILSTHSMCCSSIRSVQLLPFILSARRSLPTARSTLQSKYYTMFMYWITDCYIRRVSMFIWLWKNIRTKFMYEPNNRMSAWHTQTAKTERPETPNCDFDAIAIVYRVRLQCEIVSYASQTTEYEFDQTSRT